MSHLNGFLSTAEALRNVFLPTVCYTLRPSGRPLPSLYYQSHISFNRRYAVGPPSHPPRIARKNNSHPKEHHRDRDEDKPSLQSIDRTACFIEQYGVVDGIPVCKIIDVKEARAAAKARKKPKPSSAVTKYLELNWAIDKHDLAHRLAKLREFLEQGRRVEVFLSKKKKRTRNVTESEGWQTLESIQNFVKGIEGVREIRPMDGKLLGRATLYFEGSPRVSSAAEETGQALIPQA